MLPSDRERLRKVMCLKSDTAQDQLVNLCTKKYSCHVTNYIVSVTLRDNTEEKEVVAGPDPPFSHLLDGLDEQISS